jgi:predicted aldo/keto reductase-like oxidoreductase
MYFKDYGMEKRAMEAYAALKKNAAPCSECFQPVCTAKCPYGIPVKVMLSDAHESMSFIG